MPVVERAMDAQGFNVGINLGIAGGGGIPSHLHVHVLPRWRGDTNFLETLSNTKVVSSALEQTYQKLKKAFDETFKTI
jgi:ATP adenylyltransferase